MDESIIVYGTTWCGMTQLVRRYLERMEIPYRYLDIEEDTSAVNQLRWLTGGYTNHPTVVIDGQALIEPDLDELAEALGRTGYL
ncbi:MAG TPA: glutaredoxin family protein [Bacteroidales bacterium]|nr:glutaredoxin family protein [Bacteroidales bacterium]